HTLAMITGLQRYHPRGAFCDPPEHAGAIERRQLDVLLEAVEEIGIRDQHERAKRFGGHLDHTGGPRVPPHGALADVEGQQPGARVPAEQERVVVEGKRERVPCQLSMPSRRWSSRWAAV